MTKSERLRDGYYKIRRRNEHLRWKISPAFEGQPWVDAGKTQMRDGLDGSVCLVSKKPNGIEVKIISPNGVMATFR